MDLRIKYREYHQPCKFDKDGKYIRGLKGIDYIRCKDDNVYEPKVWLNLAQKHITENGLSDLYEQIKAYVDSNCPWVKPKDLNEYSAQCLLGGSYRAWNDFNYQERLFV